MDTKKLDKWAELLLDTGKRNNLINFKDRKASTVEVLWPSVIDLFSKMDDAATFEVYNPRNDDIEDFDKSKKEDNEVESHIIEEDDAKKKFITKYSHKIKKNKILLYSMGVNPITAIKNIDKKSKEFIEETGVNVAYMAFGFIHWKESDSSNYIYSAPMILVPIHFEQASAIDPYFIHSTSDDIIVNPTFAYKMDAEYGIKLPEYEDEGLAEYIDKVRDIVKRLQWTVSAECKIGMFSFLKINMYRDLKDNVDIILKNKNIQQLLGEFVEKETINGSEENEKVTNQLIDLHNVVDADSSQIEAIEMAKSGKSFVLQGPPGTGKSQTITNIIAECLSDGKKVLFVSEKLAALNVVYEKLKNVGLSEFCLELHSHKANKKDIITNICHTIRMNKSTVSAKVEHEIAIKEKAQKQLNDYAIELHRQRSIIDMSLYQLYESFAAFSLLPTIKWNVPQIESKAQGYLQEISTLLEQYVDFIPSIGYDYKKNPWYGYAKQDISYQTKIELKNSLEAIIKFLKEIIPILKEVSERYSVDCSTIEDARKWYEFFCFASDSQVVTPKIMQKENFGKISDELPMLRDMSNDICACQTDINGKFDKGIYEIDGAKYYKILTSRFDGFFSRLFSSEYKKIISGINVHKSDGGKCSYTEAVSLLKNLAHCHEKVSEYKKKEIEIGIGNILGGAYQGVKTNWEYVVEQLGKLQHLFSNGFICGNLTECEDFVTETNAFANYSSSLNDSFHSCERKSLECLNGCFNDNDFNIENMNCESILNKCTMCLENIDKIDNWCHFRGILYQLDKNDALDCLDEMICKNIEPQYIVNSFKKKYYYQWIDFIISNNPVLTAFNRISQDKAINVFVEKDREQFEINKAKIRAELSAKRPSLDMIAPGSALAVLLREGEKKRKQKSIRSLLEETGELVQRIKPCFLMSPLSVSTFLTANSVHFDVVVFDEASQIFPQDAIGAIYRGNQLIVVGDSKQMPPSNFFNAAIESDIDDEDHEDVTDFESILDLCLTSMQQLRLRWHYRSRYEQLIMFSNKNFYDNDLITFPSLKVNRLGIGVDYYHVDGFFDRKAHINRKEAEYVVDLIYKNIDKYPNRSLGVVAFSVAQQDLIDKLLMRRRQVTPEKEYFFQNVEKEPFFIKNLETVQGDERDTIIFSVAYGIDAQGRLLHNFGPLNRSGGERRLNVAITRAKDNVQLVSSMHATDIDLKRTSAEGARLLREYLDFAENGNIAFDRVISVNNFEQFDSDFELEVCDFLRTNGFSVDTQVGCSGYRIDLGLKRAGSSDYVLAIECDGATYHSSKNARDRDRLRQEILERMGWKFYRIWSTDWFRNRKVEEQRLLEAVNEIMKAKPQEMECQSSKTCDNSFEEVVDEKHFEFPIYQEADIDVLSNEYLPNDFQGLVKAILNIEAPLSEELLLKRVVQYFGREKVTSVVQRAYENEMFNCQQYGIVRRNGFLYLESNKEIEFRSPGNIVRSIKQIAPEELAVGMMEILKQNMKVEKLGLYRLLALQCGVSRVTKSTIVVFDVALKLIAADVVIEDDQISIR